MAILFFSKILFYVLQCHRTKKRVVQRNVSHEPSQAKEEPAGKRYASVDLLDGGSTGGIFGGRGTTGTAHVGHTTHVGHAAGGAAGTAAHLLEDGHGDGLEGLLLLLVLLLLGGLVGVEPLDGVVDGGLEGLLLVGGDLVLDLVGGDGALEAVAVVLEAVLGLDAVAVGVVLGLELLGLGDHALDLVLGETSLVVRDGDLLLLAGGLLDGGDVEDAVGVDVEGDVDLGLAAGHGGDAVEVELAEDVVVAGHGALALEDLDKDAGLVVGVGGEGLGLLGGDGGVALDEGGHDAAGGLEAEGEGGDVKEEELGELLGLVSTGEDGGLDGGAEGDGLVGVDGLAGLLAVEEVGKHRLDLGDAGGSANEYDLIDSSLGDLGVAQDLLDGVHALLEVVHAQVLEAGPGDGRVEVDAVEEGVDLDVGLGR